MANPTRENLAGKQSDENVHLQILELIQRTTYDGKVPEIDPKKRLPFERAYMRKNPCTGCPFSRTGTPEKDGVVDPLRLIGQAHGPFLLPCHQEPRYAEERQGAIYEMAQCAGAAIFRANLGVDKLLPESFHKLPADTDTVFETPAELLASYGKITMTKAEEILKDMPPQELLDIELHRQSVRVYGYSKAK